MKMALTHCEFTNESESWYVGNQSKFTQEEFLKICINEGCLSFKNPDNPIEDEYRQPTLDDVYISYAKEDAENYEPDWYVFCDEKEEGAFPVWTIDLATYSI